MNDIAAIQKMAKKTGVGKIKTKTFHTILQ